jgi:OmpA-OmpF porin, OOP family
MAIDLLSLAKGYLTSEVVGKVSSYLGETPANTGKALDGAIPAILAGVLRTGSTESGASALLRTIQRGYDGSLLNNLPGVLGGGAATQNLVNSGSGLLNTIFGGNLGSIVSILAGNSGVKNSSVSSLLSLAGPIVMSILGKQVASQGLNASGLMSLLLGQGDTVRRALPMTLATLLGDATGAADQATPSAGRAAEEASGGARLLWPLLIAALLALGVWYFLRSGHEVGEDAKEAGAADAADAGAEAAKNAGAAATDAAKKLVRFALPGGINLDLPEGTINFRLARFLEGSEGTLPQTFVFDNLNFDTASHALTTDSQQTVANLAAILKAYPKAQVRLDGHTDNQGDAGDNKKLSLGRADVVKASLVKLGIDAGRVATAGWGQEKPIASNDTEEGRAQNRRTELTVVKR